MAQWLRDGLHLPPAIYRDVFFRLKIDGKQLSSAIENDYHPTLLKYLSFEYRNQITQAWNGLSKELASTGYIRGVRLAKGDEKREDLERVEKELIDILEKKRASLMTEEKKFGKEVEEIERDLEVVRREKQLRKGANVLSKSQKTELVDKFGKYLDTPDDLYVDFLFRVHRKPERYT